MKSSMSAYAIGTSHIEEKVNVLNVKDLARSNKINLWFKQWHPISKWIGTKWHILNIMQQLDIIKEISTMIIEINSHWSNNKMLIINLSGGGEEPKTPLQSTFEGKDIKNTDKECYGSNN